MGGNIIICIHLVDNVVACSASPLERGTPIGGGYVKNRAYSFCYSSQLPEPKLLLFENDEPPVQSPSPNMFVCEDDEGASHEASPKGERSPPVRASNDVNSPFSTLKATTATLGGL